MYDTATSRCLFFNNSCASSKISNTKVRLILTNVDSNDLMLMSIGIDMKYANSNGDWS